MRGIDDASYEDEPDLDPTAVVEEDFDPLMLTV